MAIAIPALVDTQLAALKASISPHTDSVTKTSAVGDLFPRGNRVADILRVLTGLIDTGTLVATGGTTTSVVDAGAFTGVNSLVGAKITFAGNVTALLAGKSAYVVSNTVNACFFAPGAIPAAPAVGDNYAVEFTSIDKDLVVLEGGKGLGESQSNPYSYGPSMINAINTVVSLLGGSVPSWLKLEPFTIGSPHAGGSAGGHGGALLIAAALQLVRDTVAAYTKPT